MLSVRCKKACLCRFNIYKFHIQQEQNKAENVLEKEINFLQQSLNESPCEETKRKLALKQNELQELREHRMRGIAIRSKANWITRGEKSTKYFLNLEKRHYTNKLIPKLQWATKVLRHFVILEYLRQISFLISTILPPPPFSMLDFLSLEFASFLYNIEKGVGGWLSK